MATQITASTPRTRPAGARGISENALIAVLTVLAVAIIGVGVWTYPTSTDEAPADVRAYGVGYPRHGGLAGPSRVASGPVDADPTGSGAAAEHARHFGPDYPRHLGLAGPSRVAGTDDAADHYGPDYPAHGGLAGPSRLGVDR